MEPIVIDGIMTESLAKGLMKRMTRELEENSKRQLEMTKTIRRSSAARWKREVRPRLTAMFGEFLITSVVTAKNKEDFYYLTDHPLDGSFYLMTTTLNYKRCTSSTGFCSIALSAHAVTRFIERVNRPFTWNDVARLVTHVAEQIKRKDYIVGTNHIVCTPDGILFCECVESEELSMPIMMVKTFLASHQLNGEYRNYWEKGILE
jgi:hypothetical protein